MIPADKEIFRLESAYDHDQDFSVLYLDDFMINIIAINPIP